MTVRPATMQDAARIAALAGQLGYPSTASEIAGRMRDLAAEGNTAVFVAEGDGIVTGWIAVGSHLSLESGPFAEIAGLVVDESHRGGRVGEALVAAAEAWAGARGYLRMRVRSNVVRERAHAFYRRLGYGLVKRQAVFDKNLA